MAAEEGKRKDHAFDEAQSNEVVRTIKTTVATKLTGILESWDILSKEEIRRLLSLARDELVKNSDAADDVFAEHVVPGGSKAVACPIQKCRKEKRKVARVTKAGKTTTAYNKLSGDGGVDVDADEAVALLEEQVKDRDREAMWMLGLCYEYGLGIEQDLEEAIVLYEKSYKAGSVIGEFLLLNGGRGSRQMTVDGLYIFMHLGWITYQRR